MNMKTDDDEESNNTKSGLSELEEVWLMEAQKRLNLYRAGKMKTYKMDEIFDDNHSITS